MDAYEQVQKGPLKLKGGPELGMTKRKKKKDRGKAKLLQMMGKIQKNQEEELRHHLDKRTPAQVAFEKVQEKRQMERVLKKASITHKQRVEDFNRHLDTLTEHYDIPKVSWTKDSSPPAECESSPQLRRTKARRLQEEKQEEVPVYRGQLGTHF
ncbi:hypothetical protein R6Z07F_013786 [Ovis aries]